jgi:hypothetical protein
MPGTALQLVWDRFGLFCAAFLLVIAAPARALPPPGAQIPAIIVEDTAGRAYPLPNPRLPVLVIYEDQGAGKQNARAREAVGQLNDRPENQARFGVMPIADLEKWNWWPARKYALDDLRIISQRNNTPLFCDWKGALRRSWGLTRGKSG